MAQKLGRQTEWPRVKRDPEPRFVVPDGYYDPGRGVAADYGKDRVSPRDFDPEGTTRNRFGEISSERLPTDPTIKRRDLR